mmetsp:Transcript_4856/g.652  ORF Transcript_4856/g.652 Transcript_4856/m.652 type:complete len:97 (+) Transcript_4856:719-1009(+)
MILIHFLNNKIMAMKAKAGVYTGQRVQLITNIIEGVRIIKLYGWEKYFNEEVCSIRLNEAKQGFKKGLLDSVAKMLNIGGLGISLLIIFSLYKATD